MPTRRDDKRPRDATTTRQTILNAAEHLFAANGFEATKIQDISNHAGVSRGTPAYFFGSKEQLYRTVLERSFASAHELVARIRSEIAATDLSAAEALETAIGGYYDYLIEHPTFVRLIEWESLGDGTHLSQLPTHVASLRGGIETLAEGASPTGLDEDAALHLLIDMIALCWFPLAHGRTLLEGLGIPAAEPAFHARRKKHVATVLIASLHNRQEES